MKINIYKILLLSVISGSIPIILASPGYDCRTGEAPYICQGAGQTPINPPYLGYQCFVNTAGYGIRCVNPEFGEPIGSYCEPTTITCSWTWKLSCPVNPSDPDSPSSPDSRTVESTMAAGVPYDCPN